MPRDRRATDRGESAPARSPHPVGLVDWRAIPGKGRGVVALRDCAAGTELERAPAIVVPRAELLVRPDAPTVFDRYLLYWSDEPRRELAMVGGLVMFYNHSDDPNIELRDGPDADTLSVVALRAVRAGEELVYDYDTELWFEVM